MHEEHNNRHGKIIPTETPSLCSMRPQQCWRGYTNSSLQATHLPDGERMSALQLTGVVFGLLSVYFSVKQNIWTWPTGIISVSAFGIPCVLPLVMYPGLVLTISILTPRQRVFISSALESRTKSLTAENAEVAEIESFLFGFNFKVFPSRS